MKLSRFGVALAVMVGAIAGPLVLAQPAHASETDSIAVGGMVGCGDIATPKWGGWEGARFFASRNSTSTKNQRPTFLRLHEPCKLNSTTLAVRWQATAPQDGDWAFTDSTNVPMTFLQNNVKCYNASNAIISAPSGNTFGAAKASPTVYVTNGNATFTIPSTCVRLISITMEVDWEIDSPNAYDTPTRTTTTWKASGYVAQKPYTSVVYPPEMEQLCAELGNASWVTCEQVLAPSPTAWGDTCGEQNNSTVYGTEYATFNAVDGATWGPALSWTMACLFVPLGTFDRNFVLADAAEAHPNAAVINGYTTIATAFQSSGSCGVLLDATGTVLDGFVLDSCTWTWAAPWRYLLYVVGLSMMAWWALSYIVNSSFAVMNKKIVLPWQDPKGGGI